MIPFKAVLLTLVICCQWWGASATVLNILQYGNGTNATYGVTVKPIGTAITTAIGAGVAALGIFAILGRGIPIARIPIRRFGRSLEEPATGVELALAIVESLDTNGCAKRLLCEEAALSVQAAISVRKYGDDEDSSDGDKEPPFRYAGDDDDEDADLDDFGELILNFVRNEEEEEIPLNSSRNKWLEVVKFGEQGGDCTLSPCPLDRRQILRDLQLSGVLKNPL